MIAVRWSTPYSPLRSLFHYTRNERLTLCGRTIWPDVERFNAAPIGVRFCERCVAAESMAHALPESFEARNAEAAWTDAARAVLAKALSDSTNSSSYAAPINGSSEPEDAR